MTASRLDELTVNDFDDAADHVDLTTDIRSGAMPDAALFSLNAVGEVQLTAESPAASMPSRSGSVHVAGTAESANAAAVEASGPGARLARGTEPLQPAIDPHLTCTVQLHEALTSLLALESVITRNGGHLWPEDQRELFAARELLRKNGRR